MKTDLKSMRNWSRGYYCAVAKLLEYEGTVTPIVDELYRTGGGAAEADHEDKAQFAKHGLMPSSATPTPEGAR